MLSCELVSSGLSIRDYKKQLSGSMEQLVRVLKGVEQKKEEPKEKIMGEGIEKIKEEDRGSREI